MRVKGLDAERIRSYLAQALLQLMRQERYDKISIGEIAQKAGVNRSSYYRHFKSKDDIIRYHLTDIMAEYLVKHRKAQTQGYSNYLLQMFETFRDHRDDLLLIHENGISHLLLDVLNSCFRFSAMPEETGPEAQFALSYHIGGIYNNLLLWMDHGMREPSEQMADIALSVKPNSDFTLLGANLQI